jgi:hypothetical protein
MLSVSLLPSIGKQITIKERKLNTEQSSTPRGVVGDEKRIQNGIQRRAVELNNGQVWSLSAYG